MFNQVEMVYVNSAQTAAGKVSSFGREGVETVLNLVYHGLEAPTAAEVLPCCQPCEGYLCGRTCQGTSESNRAQGGCYRQEYVPNRLLNVERG
jgi:hypothetical protein